MMSYLWILLLGSLLASHAKAQDDAQPNATVAPDTGETEQHQAADGEADPATVTESTKTESDSETGTDPEPAADPEPEADPETTPAPEPAADPEPEAEPETTPAPEPAADLEPAADPETTPAPEPAADSEPAANPETTTVPEQAADPEATPEPVVEHNEGGEESTTPAAPAEGVEPVTPAKADANVEPPSEVTSPVTPNQTVGPAVDPEDANPEGTEAAPTQAHDLDAGIEVAEQTTPAIEFKPNKDKNPTQETNADPTTAIIIKERRFIGVPLGKDPSAGAVSDDNTKTEKGGSKNLAGILSGIIVAAVGAVAGYFTYQKKKLCFKKEEADPEAGHKVEKADADAKSEPQESNTLLNSSQP